MREALIDATVVLAHRRGAQSLTVASAADEACLAREIAGELFATEHELLVATLGSLVDEWTRLTEPEPGADPVDALRSSVRVMFEPPMCTPERVATWLSMWALASSHPELRALRERAQRSWADQFARSLDAAGVANADQHAIAVLAMADGLWLRHYLEPDSLPTEAALRSAMGVVDRLLDT